MTTPSKKDAPESKNPKLTEAIEKIGGQMEVAYRMKVHLSTVYDWDKAGRVRDSWDAVQFVKLAAKHGVELTVDQIAAPANGERPGPRRGRKPKLASGSFRCFDRQARGASASRRSGATAAVTRLSAVA